MRIFKMTATFGKLEHETLSLKPGLNIIHAPNEWGKSTWCAFLMAMLYGLDTRAKSTKTALADKERYAPWSGSPMSGRIDLHWQGRDITIERNTRGRIPMGVFRAYETETGVDVPELTAANCGQLLLGVEQSVSRRAGFIRLSDLPVTQDEALRRRLNALVTTGDESGDGDRLEKELRELKNRCRYNRSGLIPQAEAEREDLEDKLEELDALEGQCRKLKIRLDEVKEWLGQLENHRDALVYAAAEEDAKRVAEVRNLRDRAEEKRLQLEEICSSHLAVLKRYMVMLLRLVQPENAQLPMLVTLSGRVMLLRFVQRAKAKSPMLVTLLPMVTLLRFWQSANVPLLMVVTLLGMVMMLRLSQPENASSPMLETLSGMVTLIRFMQSANAPFPMVVTLSGMVMLVRLPQPLNAQSPMLVTLLPMETLPRLVQL